MAEKQIKNFNAIITRQRKISRRELEFEEYTDWLSTGNRINPVIWEDYLLTVDNQPIITYENLEIEVIKNGNSNT